MCMFCLHIMNICVPLSAVRRRTDIYKPPGGYGEPNTGRLPQKQLFLITDFISPAPSFFPLKSTLGMLRVELKNTKQIDTSQLEG